MNHHRTRKKIFGLLTGLVIFSISLTAGFHFHQEKLTSKVSNHCVVCQVAHQLQNLDIENKAELPIRTFDSGYMPRESEILPLGLAFSGNPSRAPPAA